MNLESSTDICTLPCVKQMASGKLPHRHRELGSAPCDDLRDDTGVVCLFELMCHLSLCFLIDFLST